MPHSFLPMLLVVVGIVGYQIAQKAVPGGANPFVVIGAAYLAGLLVCAAVVVAARVPVAATLAASWRPAVGVGLAALAIEIGYLLAYRAGWPLSSASLVASVAAAVLLLGVGALALGETLTLRQLAGVACCLVGLALVASR